MFQVDFSLSGRDDVHHPPTLPLEWNYHTAEEEILLGPGFNFQPFSPVVFSQTKLCDIVNILAKIRP